MSYNPVNWVNGETPINDVNLNNMDQGILEAHKTLANHDKKIDGFANQQLPEEYLKEAVDTYVSENEAGLFTKAEGENLNAKIDEEVGKLSSEIVDIGAFKRAKLLSGQTISSAIAIGSKLYFRSVSCTSNPSSLVVYGVYLNEGVEAYQTFGHYEFGKTYCYVADRDYLGIRVAPSQNEPTATLVFDYLITNTYGVEEDIFNLQNDLGITSAELEEIKGGTMAELKAYQSTDCFANERQRVCVFYDTFVRADSDNVGYNGDLFTWEENDYLMISDNRLRTKTGYDRKGALISAAITDKLTNDFAVETVIRKDNDINKNITMFFKNETNFLNFAISNDGAKVSITTNVRLNGATTKLSGVSITSNSKDFSVITMHYLDKHLYLYINQKLIAVIDLSQYIDKLGKGIGLLTGNTYSYSCEALSVFTFRPFKYYESAKWVRSGNQPEDIQEIYPNRNGYSVEIGAESHSLFKETSVDNSSAHCETLVSDEYFTPLKKTELEFDKYFGDEFIADGLDEIICQFHGRNNTIGKSFSPNIAIILRGDKLLIDVIGSPSREIETTPSGGATVEIGSVESGKWKHFKFVIQEGCSLYHRPSIAMYIDDKYVGCVSVENQYCEDMSDKFQYGIYKWGWVNSVDKVTERTYLTANVKYKY